MLLWTGHLCHCQLNGRDLVVYLKIEFWGGEPVGFWQMEDAILNKGPCSWTWA